MYQLIVQLKIDRKTAFKDTKGKMMSMQVKNRRRNELQINVGDFEIKM